VREPRPAGRLVATIVLAIAIVVAAGASASAASSEPIRPWDGTNPFRCEVQDVGTGVDFPDRGADPFCVEFDKTQQSLLPDAGLVDFLAKEPARTAAALPKCFYHQEDHWTGSIVQGMPPELWHWDGSYFFDKARAAGGVSVHNFRIAGIPMDASMFAPEPLKPFFYTGGGGAILIDLGFGADPRCAARVDTAAERQAVYRRWYRRAL
jgi:hypothetical protein